MKETIKFIEKNVYGRNLIYPNSDKANILQGLIAGKTFTMSQLEMIAALGFNVELITLDGKIATR